MPERRAVGLTLLLMLIAALENTVAPWAPFYVVYAVLALALPFTAGVTLGKLSAAKLRHWVSAVALAVALQGVFRLIVRRADLPGMFGAVFEAAAPRLGRPPASVAGAYLVFILAWAGLGEEVFYRGYLQARLRPRLGTPAAVVTASALYALRHYTQVLLAWPHVPWGSATVWVAATFIVGLAFGWLFELSGSLLPPILCHYLFNLLG